VTDQFLGEIRIFGGNFAPLGWALCNGQIMPISQSTALFSLLGTYYGGDGKSTFALPNLQGQFALNQGQGTGLSPYVLGESGGSAAVTLTQAQIPTHTHAPMASATSGTATSPAGAVWAEPRAQAYGAPTAATMSATALATSGASQPHNNLPPYLALTFIIALQGIFPPRS
jgi:microcystin-dependent protein